MAVWPMHLALALSLPAEVSLLPATRRAVAGYLSAFGTPAEVLDDVILALDEACSNVMRHAFPADAAGSYQLRADLRPNEIVVEVVDGGVGFDTMSRQASEHLAVSGRGLQVMRRLMTSVEVESPTPEGGTRLRMRKHLPVPSVEHPRTHSG